MQSDSSDDEVGDAKGRGRKKKPSTNAKKGKERKSRVSSKRRESNRPMSGLSYTALDGDEVWKLQSQIDCIDGHKTTVFKTAEEFEEVFMVELNRDHPVTCVTSRETESYI